MADIELVIKLDEDIAQGIIDGKNDAPRNIVRAFQCTIADAIKNGTPLPKGHGDLIDRDNLLVDSYYTCDLSGNEINIVEVMTVKMADAIIEADKEQTDG
jgi:hypothetical protein